MSREDNENTVAALLVSKGDKKNMIVELAIFLIFVKKARVSGPFLNSYRNQRR
jgi:hypothetical protein